MVHSFHTNFQYSNQSTGTGISFSIKLSLSLFPSWEAGVQAKYLFGIRIQLNLPVVGPSNQSGGSSQKWRSSNESRFLKNSGLFGSSLLNHHCICIVFEVKPSHQYLKTAWISDSLKYTVWLQHMLRSSDLSVQLGWKRFSSVLKMNPRTPRLFTSIARAVISRQVQREILLDEIIHKICCSKYFLGQWVSRGCFRWTVYFWAIAHQILFTLG